MPNAAYLAVEEFVSLTRVCLAFICATIVGRIRHDCSKSG